MHIRSYVYATLIFILASVLFLGIPFRVFNQSGVAFVAQDVVDFYPPYRANQISSPTIHNSIIADNMMVYAPSYWSLYQHILQGSSGGYNPYSFSGRLGGGIGSELLLLAVPMLLAHLHGSFWLVFTFEAVINLTLAGICMFALLRWWNISFPIAVLVSVVWMFAQHQIVWLQFPAHLRAQLWIPLIILFFERTFANPSIWRLATFGFVLGLAWSVGYTQITSYVLLFLGVYFWFLMYLTFGVLYLKKLQKAKGMLVLPLIAPIAWRVVGFAMAVLIFIGLGGYSVLGKAESITASIRSTQADLHTPECSICSLAGFVQSTILFIHPYLLGNHVQHPYFGYKNLVEFGRYMTWVPLCIVVAGVGLRYAKPSALRSMSAVSQKKALFFAVMAVFVFLLMEGAPVITNAFYAIPFLNLGQATRMITLVLLGSLLSMALYADAVLDWIARVRFSKKARHRVVQVAAVIGVIVGIFSSVLGFDAGWQITAIPQVFYNYTQWLFGFDSVLDARFFMMQAPIILVLLTVYVGWLHFWRRYYKKYRTYLLYTLVGLVYFELLLFGYSFQTFSKADQVLQDTQLTVWLQENTKENRVLPSGSVFLPNTHAIFGIKSITGYSTAIPSWYMEWVSNSFSDYSTTYNGYLQLPVERNSMVDQLAVQYVLQEVPNEIVLTDEDIESEDQTTSQPEYAGLAYVTTLDGVRVYQNERAWPRVWWTPELCDRDHCILEYDAQRDQAITMDEWHTTGFIGSVRTHQIGTLVISNLYSDRWQLYLDQEELAVFPVNQYLTGVMLPDGDHTVRLGVQHGMHWRYSTIVLSFSLAVWAGIRWFLFRDFESGLFFCLAVAFLSVQVMPFLLQQPMPE